MKKIETLTQEQEQQLIAHRNEWLSHGRSTEPMNRELAVEGLKYFYKRLNEKEPFFWFCDSPMQAQIIMNLLKNGIGKNIHENIKRNIEENIKEKVDENILSHVAKQNSEYFSTYVYGQFDSYFVAYYTFAEKYLGIKFEKEKSEDLHAWEKICKSCCITWTFRNICFISDRPKTINLDESGFLHNDNGPCIEFRDGYKFYADHGVNYPDWVHENPEKLNVSSIQNETIEIRRIMISKYGIERYLQESGSQVVDFESGENITRGLIRDNQDNMYLCGHDGSTDRVYYMSVNPNSKTCREAHEGICNLDEDMCVAEV